MINEYIKSCIVDEIITLLGISENENGKIYILVDSASNDAYTYTNTYNDEAKDVIRDMTIEKYNKLGSEGINSRSFSGVSETYTDDYSPSIYKRLRKFRKLRTI